MTASIKFYKIHMRRAKYNIKLKKMRVESKGEKNEFNRMLRNVKVLRFIKKL